MEKELYRSLKKAEIDQMTEHGCTADSWDLVLVKKSFQACCVKNTHFSGENYLGEFHSEVEFPGGIKRKSGIYSSTLHNCSVGDNAFISGVQNYIANYDIGEGVVINNVERIYVEGSTTFGNGHPVAVLNEIGGREVCMFNELSSHLAYMLALYRHRSKAVDKLNRMIDKYAQAKRNTRGAIGAYTHIVNSGSISNVWIGEHAIIDGAKRLQEGSINSVAADPVYIGFGVIASHFILSSGSRMADSVLLDSCFVGQGVELNRQYSAQNSLFFSNCVGSHGEASAVFAGPYTVSHHKSTLLISAYFSFLNAGSGSNQSNHMYKLGPIHQGIVERGSKTTSDSYLLWPSRIGAFSLVMGRHYKNSDTSDLPFSYLIESNDESILVPAINLQSVGTVRDAQKWPRRDKRKDPVKLDLINFNLLSPFTIQKMINGRKVLRGLRGNSGRHSDYFFYENCKIHRRALERGIELYTMGIQKFLGNSLISRMDKMGVKNADELFVKLEPCHRYGWVDWVDLAGLVAPKQLGSDLLDQIEGNHITTVKQVTKEFAKWHKEYYEMEWTWAKSEIEKEFGIPISKLNSPDIVEIIQTWKKAVVDLDELLYQDARKEFALSAHTGFGIDGSENERDTDFEAVRGDFEQNPAVSAIREHIKTKTRLGDDWIKKMS